MEREKQDEAPPDWVRITLRMTPGQRDLLRRAADVAGMPVSAFVLRSACRAAEHIVIEQQARALATDVESLPTFAKPARQRWESIPADVRQRLIANVWCAHCHHEVIITNFSGVMKGNDLLLVGKCAECHGDVARVIEAA